jgi:hypothetical protein
MNSQTPPFFTQYPSAGPTEGTAIEGQGLWTDSKTSLLTVMVYACGLSASFRVSWPQRSCLALGPSRSDHWMHFDLCGHLESGRE